MVSLITIVLFFLYIWGLGFTAAHFFSKSGRPLERFFVNIGLGLGIFPLLAITLNLLHIPLDWKIFLSLSLLFPLYTLAKNFKKINWKITRVSFTKSDLLLSTVLVIALLSLYMYASGAFSYPFLENEDPWGHAVGVKYVAIEKNAYDPVLENTERDVDPVLSYIDPYPPAYNILLGILHQTSPNLPWTMKFFNALIISLSLIFFYLFAKEFTNSSSKALFATFILAALPSYLSHFIWAHSLVITLFFPTMYALIKIKEDKNWWIITALLVGSIWVTQNFSQPIKITTLFIIYIIVASIITKKFLKYESLAVVSGMFLSLTWWGAMLARYGVAGFLEGYGRIGESISEAAGTVSTGSSLFSLPLTILRQLTYPGGTGSRAYTITDFIIAKGQNAINNPIGIGVVITILVLIGVIYSLVKHKKEIVSRENTWFAVTLFWLIYTFWGVNGQTFPFSVAKGPFRVWMLLAIPVSLLATEGMYYLKTFFGKKRLIQAAVIGVLVMGVIFTSATAKYELNTATWPTSGSFTSPQEPFQYAQWFDSIPDNTKVFLYSPRDKLTIGYGKFSCEWCQEVVSFRSRIFDHSPQEIHSFLKQQQYEYYIINPRMDLKYFNALHNVSQEQLFDRYKEIEQSGLFTVVHQAEGSLIVLKLK